MGKIPEKIDKYLIEELIAAGGMGEVYRGIHPTLKRPVILKKLTLKGNANITERFKREARILMDFRNDNIVDVQDHFVQGRTHYIVMEYIDGLSVKDLLDEQRYLDNCTTAWIALHTAIALRYAHSKGVIHRDIKPGNILISKKGDIKLADFGIASARDPETGEDTLTTDGTTLGTPAYMAPEQFENSRTVDHRADLYSLGVMMYEMLTGLKPFPGGFTPETIRLIQKGRYKKPRRVNPAVSPALQSIINSLIKPNPKSRCRDINTVIRRLEKWLGRYREDEVRERLCMMLREDTPPPLHPKKTGLRTLIITIGTILAAAAVIGTVCLKFTGIHNRIFSPAEYGQIRLSVGADESDRFRLPQAQLFLDDGRDYPAIETGLIFIPGGRQIRSLPLVLAPGGYRLKTTYGTKVIWTSFTLDSWKVNPHTLELAIPADGTEPALLQVTMQVHDALTGWDLTEAALLEVYKDGRFTPVTVTALYSGAVYNFRMTADGYKKQEWVLKINPAERSLLFQADLEPLDH